MKKMVITTLRQPLEDRKISLSRASDSAEYPANFILVATANPCPCGYYGYPQVGQCVCSPLSIVRYKQKLSGPILDRIDLQASVHQVNHQNLLSQAADPAEDTAASQRVLEARTIQQNRHPGFLNGDLSNKLLKATSNLEAAAKSLLDTAAGRLNLSARGYMRTIKVARTIADLEASDAVSPTHVSEALAYRAQKPV